ncbi:enoyl-CoA hydratase [Macrococcus equipercicus]|uniref:Enoyl-CoA hydratase n=1 Tax=Macrococcus equipercicus TaxID=69967 RepID=A0ABQ6RAD7_9STAP|nr:enoyl-CoA hydratase-related protein [Macrococcus equipercicus]KAA1040264.1 enoyl-CoA hydratase [Macrococcus equipercicus]
MALIEINQYSDYITLLTLNRPASRNALNRELLLELQDVLHHLDTRVLIITGAGKAFCAGADLKERLGMTPEEADETSVNIGRKISMIEELPYVTIAALNGGAYGGGLELALACDFRLAVPDAEIGLTETSLGIIPGAGGTQRLTRLAGPSRAKELIFTAEPVSADTALELGLLEEVSADVVESAIKLAERISKNAPLAVTAAKKAVNRALDLPLADGLHYERECYDLVLNSEDRIEGLQAFKEKRKPNYKGK